MDTTTPKPFVFVLMPFDRSFDDIYQLGIKAACDTAGAYAERVDEQMFTENILDRIYNQISKADVIVSDMTRRNPNVFYETGYAHALGKKVILLTQDPGDIPFDLKHFPHIIYGGRIVDLRDKLETRVMWALEQSKSETLYQSIEFFIDGESLLGEKTIKRKIGSHFVSAFNIKIDVYNSIEKQARTSNFRIGILLHDKKVAVGHEEFRNFKQPDGAALFLLTREFRLTPGSWDSFSPLFSKVDERFSKDDSIFFTVRLFSEDGVVDFPCHITVVEDG
ncbi:MAG: hypothetical protein WBG50_26630 [Desulfomonilaceae bacterium]